MEWYHPPPILFRVRPPAENLNGPQHAEHLLAELMATNRRGLKTSLLLVGEADETSFAVEVASPLEATLKRSLVAQYPGVELERVSTRKDTRLNQTLYLRVTPDTRSLKTAKAFDDNLQRVNTDPLSSILGELQSRNDGIGLEVRFRLKNINDRRRRRAQRVAQVTAGPLSEWPRLCSLYAVWANGTLRERLSVWPLRWFGAGELEPDTVEKLDGHLYEVVIELTARYDDQPGKELLASKRLRAIAAAFAPFTKPGTVTTSIYERPCSSLVGGAELAALWHLPVVEKLQSDIRTAKTPHLAPPVEAINASKKGEGLPLGTAADGSNLPLVVPDKDRLHIYIIGNTGSGKSTTIAAQGEYDIRQGRGVGLIDPHGDLVDDFLKVIPKSRTGDVLLIDPADRMTLSIDTMHCTDPSRRTLVAENNLSAIAKVCEFDDANAPRLMHILRNTLLTLVGTEHATFTAIRPMLTDKRFRKKLVDKTEDPEVRAFWIDEVGNWTERYEQEAMPAILNKIGKFTANEYLRSMFGRPDQAIDLRQVMDEEQILLVKLSQGIIGEEGARFAGAMTIAATQNAAMSRADMPREERLDFHLYADEYATYANESFADILAQARKYGLKLTAAQQLLSPQVSEDLIDVMLGNVWTIIAFQVAQKDADRLAREFGSQIKPEDLIQMPRYHAAVRTKIDGVPCRPFIVNTPPPIEPSGKHQRAETVRRVTARNRRRSRKRSARAGQGAKIS